MVPIPAGQFQMGQAQRETSFRAPWSEAKDEGADFDESPVRTITISHAFAMSATEITNRQYEQFDPGHRARRPRGGVSAEDNAAVVRVNWDEANAFCRWLSAREHKNYRLPTEAEWEYACRAGTTTLFNTGDVLPNGYQQLNPGMTAAFTHYFPAGSSLPPYYRVVNQVSLIVGQQPPNAWGLFDMHGHVQEWCNDWYAPYDPAATRDPVGPADGEFRVIRGGGHSHLARLLRSANRAAMEPWTRNSFIGFRIVEAPPLPAAPAAPPQIAPAPALAGPPNDPTYSAHQPYFLGPQSYVNIPPGEEGPLFSHHNHDPAITVCANGDLLAAWYTTDEETGSELAIASSRLPANGAGWTPPSLFWDCADANNHAPALFTLDDGTILHLNGNKEMPGSVVRLSHNNGYSWTRAVPCTPYTQPNDCTIRTSDGRLLATFDGNFRSGVVAESDDQGLTWRLLSDDSHRPDLTPGKSGAVIAGIHVGIIQRHDGTLWALGRLDDETQSVRFDHHLPLSISRDGGRTWTYGISPFPAISSGQRFTLRRLHEGPLLLCSYTDEAVRKDVFGTVTGGRPLSQMKGMRVTEPDGTTAIGIGVYAALSNDDGATWPVRRLVTPGGPARRAVGGDNGLFLLDAHHAELGGYMASCQEANGRIDLITSKNRYAFNLAWLRQGSPAAHDP